LSPKNVMYLLSGDRTKRSRLFSLRPRIPGT
jgi:hypothetical protein